MSTAALPVRTFGGRARYAVFGAIALMMAYVLVHNERFLIDATDREWPHIQTFKWWLLPHGLTSAIALLLGPMQFSERLRRRYAKLHRGAGRIYVAGVLIGAPLGVYVQLFQQRTMGMPASFTAAALVQSGTWMLTTLIAFVFILKGNIDQHRAWMTRSFAVALVFLEVRVIAGLTGLEQSPAGIEASVWFCNTISILMADIVLQFQKPMKSRAV